MIINEDELSEEIDSKTPNWDKERIAEIDMIILKMGISEFLFFPSIPVRATINEYLEVSKEYSTPKSCSFINGILDKIVNGDGQNIILRGMGLGGWMLQEGYMLETQEFANPQHEIRALITDLIGEVKTDEFYDAWYANHCTEADIAGEFSGEFNASNLLTLKSTAKISGDVVISKLAVEPGAEFNATCVMKSGVKELKNGQSKQEKTA